MRFIVHQPILFAFALSGCGGNASNRNNKTSTKEVQKGFGGELNPQYSGFSDEETNGTSQEDAGPEFTDNESDGIESGCDGVKDGPMHQTCNLIEKYQTEFDRPAGQWKPSFTRKEVVGTMGEYTLISEPEYNDGRIFRNGIAENSQLGPQRMMFTYEIDCLAKSPCAKKGTLRAGEDCYPWVYYDPLVAEVVLHKIAAEKNLAPQIHSFSAPSLVTKSFVQSRPFAGPKCAQNTRVRIIASEVVESVVGLCLKTLPQVSVDLISKSTIIFIRMIEMLRELHKIGIIVGDVGPSNIGLIGGERNCKNLQFFHDSANLKSIVFSNFNRAEFFVKKDLLAKQESKIDFVHASPWELEGLPRAPRDDLYRAFETFIDLITGGEVFKFFSDFHKEYKHDDNRKLVAYKLKIGMDLLATVKHETRFNIIFDGYLDQLGIPTRIKPLVGSYEGFRQTRSALRYRSDDFVTSLGAIRDHIHALGSPDSVPDYDFIILEARKIETALQAPSQQH